jgi:hypothetical protein
MGSQFALNLEVAQAKQPLARIYYSTTFQVRLRRVVKFAYSVMNIDVSPSSRTILVQHTLPIKLELLSPLHLHKLDVCGF